MGISLFCRLSEAHPQAISALQSQVSLTSELISFSLDSCSRSLKNEFCSHAVPHVSRYYGTIKCLDIW